MKTLEEIEVMARSFADARSRLAGTVQDLEDKIEALKRQYLPGIKVQVALAAEKKLALKNAIEENKGLFQKPRTVIMHGIKVGLQKGQGKIEWAKDATARIVSLIRKHFPDQVETLIKVKETPVKDALANMSVADLKKLGITVQDAGDAVVIKPADSEVEKLVDKLLKERDEEASEEAA